MSGYNIDPSTQIANLDTGITYGQSTGGGAISYGYDSASDNGLSTSYASGGSSGIGSGSKTSFFANSSQSKYEDLKQMLESSKEMHKLEAMKRIITMVAKGRSAESARELFPHVVKNVVTKNSELKKLVYLYLTRYAEQEQDLALLSIATFQHALKDPNPLIRGSAIRVLSSIRVPMISPIMLIAIKDCANDMSPYVRKTAAHAIPKLYSLDPDIKEDIIDIIGKLLSDKVSLVLGSAVAAYEEVCPDRLDLIHENYRKLCALLVDVDEWGQIIIINMLLRYARTQFLNPNRRKPLQSSSTGGDNNNEDQSLDTRVPIDPDHMLLIRSVKPLLQSRNSGVVLAVIQLYLCIAPHWELTAQLVRPLVRLLHSHREIQLIILKNIVTLTSEQFSVDGNGGGGGNDAKQLQGSTTSQRLKQQTNNTTTTDTTSVEPLVTGATTEVMPQTVNGLPPEVSTKKKKISNVSSASSENDEDNEEEEEDEEEDDEEESDDEESEEEEEEEKVTSKFANSTINSTATTNVAGGSGRSSKSIRSLFDPYLKSFFVKAKDSTQTKILKLEILTNLSTSSNISLILREFQAYILNYQDDLEFMSATIESIGQCASRIKEIAPMCLNGLVSLLSNRNESIVAQSIVVIRTQIINKDDAIISMIVRQIVKLIEKISTPQARATIVWIVAEFCARNDYARKVAPDVLRQCVRSFVNESDLVKLQALNLAAKLHLTLVMNQSEVEPAVSTNTTLSVANLERLKLLIGYVFNLAKYDLNYDVRDRGRFLRQLLNAPVLAKKVLLVPKLVPNISQRTMPVIFNTSASSISTQDANGAAEAANGSLNATTLSLTSTASTINSLASSVDSARFRIGTLSHFLGKQAADYEELPDWPEVASDPTIRRGKLFENVPSQVGDNKNNANTSMVGLPSSKVGTLSGKSTMSSRNKNGYFESDSDEESDEDDSEEEEEEDEDEEEYENEEDEEEEDDEEEEEEDEDEEDEESEIDSSDEEAVPPPVPLTTGKKTKTSKSTPTKVGGKNKTVTQDVDLLLNFDDLTISDTSSTTTNALPLVTQPLLPQSPASGTNATISGGPPYRILEGAEVLSFKEFSLYEQRDNCKVSYRFPRINEQVRTLVELIVKNELPSNESVADSAATITNHNRVQIQAPASGVVQFKSPEVPSDDANCHTLNISLQPSETRLITLAVDFNESPSLGIELVFNRSQTVKLVAPFGEILTPVRFSSIEAFTAERSKLTGMNEMVAHIKPPKITDIDKLRSLFDSIVLSVANLCSNAHLRPSSSSSSIDTFHYSGATLKFKSLLLITVQLLYPSSDAENETAQQQQSELKIRLTVNCEKMVLGSILSKMVKDEFMKQL